MRGNVWANRFAGWSLGSVMMLAGSASVGAAGVPAKPGGACRVGVIEGEVRAGESFARPIGGGLEVRLEALTWGSGWLLRVLPVQGPKLAHDYAGLATPPYDSVSPLLVSTDYSFRAQDAVAWNPRRFRFVATAAEFSQLSEVYERYVRVTPASSATEQELAAAVSQAAEGTLQILDVKLVPGTANQAQMAAMVASHFSTSAHTIQEAADAKGSPLGKLEWMRFRIGLDLPVGFRGSSVLKIEPQKCP